MPRVQLRELCGVRSGDKGNLSDLSLFADDSETYEFLVSVVTAEIVKSQFGEIAEGEVKRYEVPNLLALKLVMTDELGGGGPRSLRSDNLGKTLGGALLRLEVEVPQKLLAMSKRAGRRAPLPG